jgi:hypothetical protein
MLSRPVRMLTSSFTPFDGICIARQSSCRLVRWPPTLKWSNATRSLLADCSSAHARIHEQSIGSAVCSKPVVALFVGFPAPPQSDHYVNGLRSLPRMCFPHARIARRCSSKHLNGGAHFQGTIGRVRRSRRCAHCATVCRARFHATKQSDRTARPGAPKVICSNLRPRSHPDAARTNICTRANLTVPQCA